MSLTKADPEWFVRGAPHVWRPYCQHQSAAPALPVITARGSRLVLADGRELVDGTASWWTAAHGYNHAHIAERVRKQLEVLPHVAFGGLAHEPAYTLAALLCAFAGAPFERVFYTESGSVAVEVALKIALQFHQNHGRARKSILCFEGGYHGDTFATMSLCDPVDGMHRAFESTGVKAVHAPLPLEDGALESTLDKIGDDLACILVEPLLQGAGGMRLHSADVLKRLRKAADERGALLIFDEIATGFHRLGSAFAFHEAGVTPDLLVVGKALTGGTLPLAGTLTSEKVFEAFLGESSERALQHGPTYMGNPLACAAALASLELFGASNHSERVAKLAQSLHRIGQTLSSLPNIQSVRVHGAMLAIDLAPGTAPSSNAFAAHGAFIRPLRLGRSDVVYTVPPLTIEPADLDVLGAALLQTLRHP
jgi:adenosylmethionine---8-amino-7-oxononanoate aminotransferase